MEDDYFHESEVLQLQQNKRGYMDLYNQLLKNKYNKLLSWSEVKKLDRWELFKLNNTLQNMIKEDKSIIDIDKLAYQIQSSRSGAGGCAMTRFKCSLCGEEDMWGNTNVPMICRACAKKMATKIVHMGGRIFKEGVIK